MVVVLSRERTSSVAVFYLHIHEGNKVNIFSLLGVFYGTFIPSFIVSTKISFRFSQSELRFSWHTVIPITPTRDFDCSLATL